MKKEKKLSVMEKQMMKRMLLILSNCKKVRNYKLNILVKLLKCPIKLKLLANLMEEIQQQQETLLVIHRVNGSWNGRTPLIFQTLKLVLVTHITKQCI